MFALSIHLLRTNKCLIQACDPVMEAFGGPLFRVIHLPWILGPVGAIWACDSTVNLQSLRPAGPKARA